MLYIVLGTTKKAAQTRIVVIAAAITIAKRGGAGNGGGGRRRSNLPQILQLAKARRGVAAAARCGTMIVIGIVVGIIVIEIMG